MPERLRAVPDGSDRDLTIHRPGHLAAIGLVAVSWTSIEEGLMQFFQQLLSYQLLMGDLYDPDHPILMGNVGMLLPVVEALRTRLDLITAAAESVLPNLVVEEWKVTQARAVREASAKRGKIVHGRWYYSEARPKHLILVDHRKHEFTAYTEKEILDVATEVQTCDRNLSEFFLKCHRAYGERLTRRPAGRRPGS